MIRTVGNYLEQQALNIVRNNEVRRFKARIIEVLFPSHSFAVVAAGYSGPREVRADQIIDFGTMSRPKVFVHNEVWIEKDEAGEWHAREYIPTNRCAPTTDPNAPNVPLPYYQPPIDTSDYYPGIPGIDNFPLPPTIPMGGLPFTSLPTSTSNAYDVGDGFNGSVNAGATKNLILFTTVRAFKIVGLTAYCPVSDITLKIFATSGAYPDLQIIRTAVGTWNWQKLNTTTGAIVASWNGTTVSSTVAASLSSYITVPTGSVFYTTLTAGVATVTAIAYGLKGQLI